MDASTRTRLDAQRNANLAELATIAPARQSSELNSLIAGDLIRLAKRRPNQQDRKSCADPATEFKALVDVRNGIFHAQPGTAPDGAQRLFRNGVPWTPATIDEAADRFAACSVRLNALLCGCLAGAAN